MPAIFVFCMKSTFYTLGCLHEDSNTFWSAFELCRYINLLQQQQVGGTRNKVIEKTIRSAFRCSTWNSARSPCPSLGLAFPFLPSISPSQHINSISLTYHLLALSLSVHTIHLNHCVVLPSDWKGHQLQPNDLNRDIEAVD